MTDCSTAISNKIINILLGYSCEIFAYDQLLFVENSNSKRENKNKCQQIMNIKLYKSTNSQEHKV